MPHDSENQKEMEELSRAIVEALLGSNDVKRSLDKLNKVESDANKNFMVFVLKIDSLAKQKGKGMENCKENEILQLKPKPTRKVRRKDEKPDIVDGKVISKNERKFLDYISKSFDQEAWLKWLRLKLD